MMLCFWPGAFSRYLYCRKACILLPGQLQHATKDSVQTGHVSVEVLKGSVRNTYMKNPSINALMIAEPTPAPMRWEVDRSGHSLTQDIHERCVGMRDASGDAKY